MQNYLCEICGKKHDIYYGFGAMEPDYLLGLSEEEKSQKVEEVGYLLLIDKSFLLVKGTIYIEVTDISEYVYFEVWVRIEIEDFQKKVEATKNDQDVPLYGRIENEVFIYKDIMGLKVEIFISNKAKDVVFMLQDESHEMTIDQKNGISKDKVIGWMQDMYHPKSSPKNVKPESFKTRFKKIIKEVKTNYFSQQKSFMIDISIDNVVMFQIVSPDFFEPENINKEFVIYLPFDISEIEAERSLERFKQTKYFDKFKLDHFDGMPTFNLNLKSEKELEQFLAKIIKDVYQENPKAVSLDITEP